MNKKTVILHIGLPKTGTTSLQQVLHFNSAQLKSRGIHYLENGTQYFDDFGHHAIAVSGMGIAGARVTPHLDLNALRQVWHQALDEIRYSPHEKVFLSSELFSMEYSNENSIRSILQALTDNGQVDIKVVVVLRDVADFVNSVYMQRVRDGAPDTIEEFIPQIRHLLDWKTLVERWAAVAGKGNVVCLKFEDLAASNLVSRFCEIVFGITERLAEPEHFLKNPSLPDAAINLIHKVNRSEISPAAKIGLANHLSKFFADHPLREPKTSFLSPEQSQALRAGCRWPQDVIS
ncbi:Sulfotransferase family protein [Gemmobacter aquatilis]|uniref:Sulfotransferase family protein n=1 Tax=Gemmobacter aquatilis TaxID=933059 RepID=A0A1H8NJB6_9RHOB|nr:sulfotransferase domain-containing protein [Gemmobacter aquatilis]SEO29677.1 Sulfotransferase family protein [Gemmobacter aquatilis]